MKQKRKLLVLLSCAAFCFTLFVFSPGDFLISHQSDFWFTWGDLGLAFFGVFAAGLLVLYACGRIAFRSSLIYSAVMTALALLAYVQGNYINADYGLLDGSVIDWSQYTVYGIITTILWGGCYSHFNYRCNQEAEDHEQHCEGGLPGVDWHSGAVTGAFGYHNAYDCC